MRDPADRSISVRTETSPGGSGGLVWMSWAGTSSWCTTRARARCRLRPLNVDSAIDAAKRLPALTFRPSGRRPHYGGNWPADVRSLNWTVPRDSGGTGHGFEGDHRTQARLRL